MGKAAKVSRETLEGEQAIDPVGQAEGNPGRCWFCLGSSQGGMGRASPGNEGFSKDVWPWEYPSSVPSEQGPRPVGQESYVSLVVIARWLRNGSEFILMYSFFVLLL